MAATGATLHLGRRAVLDTAAHRVEDERDERYTYHKLLLRHRRAPRALPFGGERVLRYCTLPDYRRLRALAQPDAHIAVVGGGSSAAELAASLRGAGCRVPVFPRRCWASGCFPPRWRRHRRLLPQARRGLHPGERVAGGRADAQGVQLTLASGASRRPDAPSSRASASCPTLAPAELGRARRGQWHRRGRVPAQQCARRLRRGRRGASRCRARPAPTRRARDNALQMGRAAALNMAGLAEPWTHLPFFYSDLFDFGYEGRGPARRARNGGRLGRAATRARCTALDDGRVRRAAVEPVGTDRARPRALAERGPHDAESLRGRLRAERARRPRPRRPSP